MGVVLFASTNSGARNLAELQGKSILLPPDNTTLATWAKATLFEAGLAATDVRICSADLIPDPAEVIVRVIRGESDVSVVQRQQFERAAICFYRLSGFPTQPKDMPEPRKDAGIIWSISQGGAIRRFGSREIAALL